MQSQARRRSIITSRASPGLHSVINPGLRTCRKGNGGCGTVLNWAVSGALARSVSHFVGCSSAVAAGFRVNNTAVAGFGLAEVEMVVEGVVVCRSVVGVGVRSVVAESVSLGARVEPGRSAFLGAPLQKMGAGMSARFGDRPAAVASASRDTSQQTDFKSLSDEEWKKRLTQQQFDVARKKGTERAFTGEFWNTKTAGTFLCVCCKTPLFSSSTKFDSGTGWPSYYEYIGDNVKSHTDWSIPFMPRTEVVCSVCDAHLGHVFSDGPRPTGKRYCINSAALDLKPEKQ